MIHSQWVSYGNRLYASQWHDLFAGGDGRSGLTWTNRLENFQATDVYNFYSSGEEVLRTATDDPPPGILTAAETEFGGYLLSHTPLGTFAWAWQEKGKGRSANDKFLGSTHGGWKFNYNPPYLYTSNGLPAFMTPEQAAQVPDSQLQTNAFFDLTSSNFAGDAVLLGTSASGYAQTNRNRILADAIPALTLPVGANSVTNLDVRAGEKRNFDVNTELKNGWSSFASWTSTTPPCSWTKSILT